MPTHSILWLDDHTPPAQSDERLAKARRSKSSLFGDFLRKDIELAAQRQDLRLEISDKGEAMGRAAGVWHQPPNHALACAETGAKSSSVTPAMLYWTLTELQSYFLTISTSRVCAASACFIIASRLTLGGTLHSERSSTSSPINSSGSMMATSEME